MTYSCLHLGESLCVGQAERFIGRVYSVRFFRRRSYEAGRKQLFKGVLVSHPHVTLLCFLFPRRQCPLDRVGSGHQDVGVAEKAGTDDPKIPGLAPSHAAGT